MEPPKLKAAIRETLSDGPHTKASESYLRRRCVESWRWPVNRLEIPVDRSVNELKKSFVMRV